MAPNKILICGDSFSYDHGLAQSWVSRLNQLYSITNLSQCGCSEYKIKLQLARVDLSYFDVIMMFHTSPNRLYINQTYAMTNTPSHEHCDLLFSDVESKKSQSSLARIAYDYFVHIFDKDYYQYVHDLILSDLDQITKPYRVLHFTNFDYTQMYDFRGTLISFYDIFLQHKGNINHLDQQGNDMIFLQVTEQLDKILK
jgi:hypothetical protein